MQWYNNTTNILLTANTNDQMPNENQFYNLYYATTKRDLKRNLRAF